MAVCIHGTYPKNRGSRPPGCEKLSGQDKYRLRQGRYRILCSIEDQDLVVYVIRVGQRKDVYR
ncbi:MAG: type II toxin-antitoxin system RelE/ParE family toxin [Deltaproteobacteria bacterium]|nr:type II toxin-antitoxin system RelE/ParE family toxin [Deltaproteobacteria bacterium]MBW2342358.1 type II toxin-antitoxin system RelE/ParE family toxin [Deltaproteobacteria bacterium]